MNRKRNVSYIKPEDPEFLRVIKRQAGYDDSNHKFDELDNAEEHFVDDADSELPQVVVLKEGDLTAEEAELEKQKIDQQEAETKANLSQRVIFKPKHSTRTKSSKQEKKISKSSNKKTKLLSFDLDTNDDD